MPFAVLKSIREVSSEDKVHCASNLLQNEPAKKWKTGDSEERSAFVIIEMDTAYSIKGIDIGNESSAFVEVLVGGPACARENFKEILITCSFMTPIESRNSTNTNRVRCFNREALVHEVADEKWKLLKIVCTQPFNKHIKYGLSFIKIHVDGLPETKKSVENNGVPSLSLAKRTCGSFVMRENSPDSESESTTSLFNRWKVSRNKDTTGISSVPRIPSPASLKKANENFSLKKPTTTSSSSVEKTDPKEKPKVLDRNRNSLLFTDDDDDESKMQEIRKKRLEKLEKVIISDQERVSKESEIVKKPKKLESGKNEVDVNKQKNNETKRVDTQVSKKISVKKSPTSVSKPSTPSASGPRRPSSSPRTSEKAKKPKLNISVQYRPFNQLLSGVVLVISGIQNPDRGNLRSKALALGAKYKPDWDSSSTHLICAFKNTPKYNQVKGVGKIITRSWIEDCHSQRKRLPWRRYALDNAELAKPESEDEIFDETLKPPDSKPIITRNNLKADDDKPSNSRKNSEEDDDDVILEMYDNDEPNHSQVISSGSDTEDEIQKVIASTSTRKNATQTVDIFDVSTEEEDYVCKRNGLPKKLTFFKKMQFFVSDQLSAVEKIKVERHIETFHGSLTEAVKDANYVIANEPIVDGEEFKGETVTPLWILECNDAECLIPTKRYLVT